MNLPVDIKNETIPMQTFKSNLQPQPLVLQGDDQNNIRWCNGCYVTIIKDKELIISSINEEWIFNLPKDMLLKAEMREPFYDFNRPDLAELVIDISHLDPQGIRQPHFITTLSSHHFYSVETLLKRLKEELNVEVIDHTRKNEA